VQDPVKIEHTGIWKVNNKTLFELVRKHFPHPDAPEVATVSLLEWDIAAFTPLESDMTVIKDLIKTRDAQNAGIDRLITVLKESK